MTVLLLLVTIGFLKIGFLVILWTGDYYNLTFVLIVCKVGWICFWLTITCPGTLTVFVLTFLVYFVGATTGLWLTTLSGDLYTWTLTNSFSITGWTIVLWYTLAPGIVIVLLLVDLVTFGSLVTAGCLITYGFDYLISRTSLYTNKDGLLILYITISFPGTFIVLV